MAGTMMVEDTACLRVTSANGVLIHGTVTISSDRILQGDRRQAGRMKLLDYRIGSSVPLIAPVARTAMFAPTLEAILCAPPKARIHDRCLAPRPAGEGMMNDGILDVLRSAEADSAPFSEPPGLWAVRPHRLTLHESVS
ncbi:hypothetical protein AB0M47_27685 [Hamadaea sp. NPDC051192]|uniref:hypothetical protein n=1 Tax=Hamadaea sp. NPDC051192 TaxID=3154940 RepID=UPI00343164E7